MSHLDKLRRADVHLDALTSLTVEFVNSSPVEVEFRIVVSVDGTRPKLVQAYCRSVRELSPDAPVVVGDVLFNLRAALDHLAFDLARRHARAGFAEEKIEFPLYTDPQKYDERAARKDSFVSLMPRDVADIVRAAQPFGQVGHPLALLATLNNIDKHRHLILKGVPTLSAVFAAHPNAKGIRLDDGDRPRRYEMPDGRIMFSATIEADGPDAEVKVKTRLKHEFLLSDVGAVASQDALPLLGRIKRHVLQEVTTPLEKFL